MENETQPTPITIHSEKPTKPYGKNWKKWILIYLAIGAVLYAVVYYFVLSKQESKPYSQPVMKTAPSSSVTPDPTADWKTYTNSQYGYSFKYPTAWYDQFNISEPCKTCGGSNPGFGIQVVPNTGNLSAREFAQKEVDEARRGTPQPTAMILPTPSYFSGFDAALADGFPGGGSPGLRAYIVKGSSIYLLGFDGVEDGTANQILSTFKFTDLAVTPATILNRAPDTKPDMKIYPTEYGFTFQYPDYLILNSTSTSNTISFLEQQNDIKAQRLLVDITRTTQSLEDFAKNQSYVKSDDFPIAYEQQTIDEHQALTLTKTFSMQEMCGTGSTDKMKRVSLLLVKGTDFIAAFVVNDSCYTLENDWFSRIPPTIKFTN